MKVSYSDIRQELLRFMEERGHDCSICPSEVARQLWPNSWHEHLAAVKKVAWELTNEGRVMITQGGFSVRTPDTAGPIRLHLIG